MNAGTKIGQTIKQGNSTEQSQKAEERRCHRPGPHCRSAVQQYGDADRDVTSDGGPTTSGPVTNDGEVGGSGDAVARKAIVDAGATIGQTIEQGNSAEQSQKAKNAGAIAQNQTTGQPFTNTASQAATAAPTVGPTTSGPVTNTNEVWVDGDVVASKASVNAGTTIGQAVKQGNSAKQSQKAKDAGGGIAKIRLPHPRTKPTRTRRHRRPWARPRL